MKNNTVLIVEFGLNINKPKVLKSICREINLKVKLSTDTFELKPFKDNKAVLVIYPLHDLKLKKSINEFKKESLRILNQSSKIPIDCISVKSRKK